MNSEMKRLMEDDSIILAINGEEPKKYYKLITFDADNGKSYIVYTDGSTDDAGNVKVFASIYDPTGVDLNVYPIETENEWNVIREIMKSVEKDIINARKSVLAGEQDAK